VAEQCNSAAARYMRRRVGKTSGAWMFVSCECYFSWQEEFCATSLSLVQRSPTNYGATLCDLETSKMRKQWPSLGHGATTTTKNMLMSVGGKYL